MFKLESLLLEKVYGANAIVYHRTPVENLIELISETGYKFGDGDAYGKGLYATYDLESQLNIQMATVYGKYIVKFSVKVKKFLILDWDVFENHPDFSSYDDADEYNFIDLQLERYGIPMEYHIHPYEYTSNTAISILKIIGKHNIQNFVNGMIFTGESDGRVMVIYHPERVAVPLSVSNDDGKTFVKVVDIKNSERFKNILRNRNIDHEFSKEIYVDLKLTKKDVKDGKLIKDYSNDDKVRNFYVNNLYLTTLEGSPKIVGGKFICYSNQLITLEGAPEKVGGDFYCDDNQLTTLEGVPMEVGGDFSCVDNNLTTLEGTPKVVGSFNCSRNKLTTLEGAPKVINGNFKCGVNKLISLKGAPEKVGGSFYCYDNQLITLEGAPEKVGGDFLCFDNKLTTLEGAPKVINGDFKCDNNKLISLKGAPEKVGGSFWCDENELISLEGVPMEVGGDFRIEKNARKFTEEEVRAVCDVKGKVYV
jgi:hypothetical protein